MCLECGIIRNANKIAVIITYETKQYIWAGHPNYGGKGVGRNRLYIKMGLGIWLKSATISPLVWALIPLRHVPDMNFPWKLPQPSAWPAGTSSKPSFCSQNTPNLEHIHTHTIQRKNNPLLEKRLLHTVFLLAKFRHVFLVNKCILLSAPFKSYTPCFMPNNLFKY